MNQQVLLPASIQPATPQKDLLPRPPRQYTPDFSQEKRDLRIPIKFTSVTNNLPYGCIVELEIASDVDTVYYALQETKDATKKLLYNSANAPENNTAARTSTKRMTLPSFSIHDFSYTRKKEVWLVCWPVSRWLSGAVIIGQAIYYGPIDLTPTLHLGTYELEVDVKGEDKILFQQVKPLIEKHFGKSALPGKVKVLPASSDIYYISTNTIHLSSNKRNFIHELLHATRKHLVFASKKYNFNEETELIEEAFAEGTANMIKDELNLQENNHLIPGAVYGSTMGYNYDFRIQEPSLTTQNVQSTSGGIVFLENSRYFLGSEAFHKIALEYYMRDGKYFGKEYNERYYDIIHRTKINPDKELFYSICEELVPSVENVPCREWLDRQKVFDAAIIPGDKIFMYLNDYHTHNQWIGICSINLYETFRNGSDWVYGLRKYRKNNQPVKIEVYQLANGQKVYDNTIKIPKYENGFGTIKLYFHHEAIDDGLSFFLQQDEERGIPYQTAKLTGGGLYEIRMTSSKATRTYYRFMGSTMHEHRNQLLFGIPRKDDRNRTIQVVHENRAGKKTYLSSLRFSKQLSAFTAPFIKNNNCEPGILTINIMENGSMTTLQRNIGYGGSYGGHQFWLGELEEVFV